MGLVLVKAYKKPLPADEDITQPIDPRGRMGHMGAGAPSSFFDGPIGETAEERGMPGTGEPTEEMSAVDPRQDEPGGGSGLSMGPADLSEEEAADLESRDLGVAQAEAKKRAMKDRFKAQRDKEQGKKSGKFTRVRNPMFPKNWTGGGNWMKVPKGSLSAQQLRALENQQSFIDQLRGAGNVAVLGEKTKKVPSTGTRWKLPELEGPLNEEEEGGVQPRETFAPFTQREGQGIVDRLKGMLRHDIPDPSKAKLRSDIKQLEAALRNLFSTEEGERKAPFDPQTGVPIRGGPYESYVGVRRGRGHGAPWRDPKTGDTATSAVDRARTAADVESKQPKRVRVIQGPLPKEEEEEPEPEGPPWQDTFLGLERAGRRSLGGLAAAHDPHPFPKMILGRGDHGLGHGAPEHENLMRRQNKEAEKFGREPIHDMSAFDAHNTKGAAMRLKHAKSQANTNDKSVRATMKQREMIEIAAHDKRKPPPPESLTSQRLWQDILGWHDRARAAREKHEEKAPVKKSYQVGVVLPRRERLIGVVS